MEEMKKSLEVLDAVVTPKTVKTKLTCPHCNTEIIIEKPVRVRAGRGLLQGVSLKDMDFEQLKREKINSASVLYKATKRGANPEVIINNQIRFDAVVAELAIRCPKPVAVAATIVTPVKVEENETEENETEENETEENETAEY